MAASSTSPAAGVTVPTFSGPAAAGGAPSNASVDLDNLDFQLLNDYLFYDQPTPFNAADGIGGVGRASMDGMLMMKPEDGLGDDDDDDIDDLEDDPEDQEDGDGAGGSSSGGGGDGGSGGGSGGGGGKKRKTEPRPKTQAQIDRRRERNRILARRTRLRKKFFFESLQKQVTDLQRENVVLKDIIKGKMGDVAGTILDKCNTALPSIVTDNRTKATEVLERSDFNLMRSLQAAQRSFCITDPSLPDNPIVFASQQFLDCTGYSMEQVLGRNCRFLQGPETDRRKVDMIRKGISEGSDTSVCLLNYRADGTTFWNQFFVAALRDVNQRVVNYVGVQCLVEKPPPDDIEYAAFMASQPEAETGAAVEDATALLREAMMPTANAAAAAAALAEDIPELPTEAGALPQMPMFGTAPLAPGL